VTGGINLGRREGVSSGGAEDTPGEEAIITDREGSVRGNTPYLTATPNPVVSINEPITALLSFPVSSRLNQKETVFICLLFVC